MLQNILVTATPGVGKTVLCEILADVLGMEHINISQLVKEKELHTGYDNELSTYIQDEDKICDELEPLMLQGGKIVDHHTCDFFPVPAHLISGTLVQRGCYPERFHRECV